jgi:hypothetical protein
MPDLVPDEEQARDIRRIVAETSGAALDASTPGAGKTLVAIAAAMGRGAQQVLVIAPLGTRLGWKTTAERLGWDMPFYWLRNHKDGHAALGMLKFGEPGIYFIGPQYATSLSWDDTGKTTRAGKKIKKRNHFWDSVCPDMMIIDEVHQGTTNTRTERHKFYATLHRDFLLMLSGTPAGQRWDGIYGVTKVAWPDFVPVNVQAFKRRYCETEFDAFAWDHMKVLGEKNPGEYFASLPCVVRRVWKYDGVIDEDTVWVELSAAQRKAYRELEKTFATMIESDPFVIDFPQTLRIRLRQATLGMFSVDETGSLYYALDCKSTKLDALKRILHDDFEDEPALIVTDSKRFAKVTVARLKSQGHPTEEYSGDIKATERDEIKARFVAGETKYVVMVIKAGGTGIDEFQHAAHNMAWLSQDDSRVENEQALARIIRRGQGDLVRIRYILAEHTYDAGIMDSHIKNALAMNRSMKVG